MPVCPKCHQDKPIADFTRQNGQGPKIYRYCNECVSYKVKDVGPPEFLFPDPHFAEVCLTCPLAECQPDSPMCPILVRGRKRLTVEAMVAVNKASEGNEARFRLLVAGSKKKIMEAIDDPATAIA